MYPKNRLEALTDGIFAVAMTLLVLDLRIPEDAGQPTDEASLVRALLALAPKFLPYLLSFYVLGLSWLSLIKLRSRSETVSAGYAKACLVYLLLVTLLPFSTVVMGRFTAYTAATALYAANIGLSAAAGYVLMSLLPEPVKDTWWLERRVSLVVLFVSSMLAIALSFVFPGHAPWAFALNLGAGRAARAYRRLETHRG